MNTYNNDVFNSLTMVFNELINNIDNSFLDNLRDEGGLEEIYEQILNITPLERQRIINSDFLSYTRYSPDDKELAEEYLKDLRETFIKDTGNTLEEYGEYSISIELLNSTLDIYYENNCHSLPNIDEIVNRLFEKRCNCVMGYDSNVIKRVIKQCVLYTGQLPSCSLYPNYIEYYILHGKIPTREELEEYMRRLFEFNRNPEDFHQTDKCLVPTLNIDKLPRHVCVKEEESEGCGICQDELVEGQNIITLLPCGHKFHEDKEKCLETSCVINWLETHNVCPLCKSKIGV